MNLIGRILLIFIFFNTIILKAQNIDSIIKIIDKHTNNNDFDSVFYYIDFAKKQLKGKENRIDNAKILKEEGSAQLNMSNYPKAADFFTKAMRIAKNNSDNKLIAGIKSELAVLYFETGDTVKSRKNISEAYKIMKEEGFYDVYITFNYGVVMYTQTNGKKALQFFLKEQKNVPDTAIKIKSYLNNFIGHSFKKEGNYKKALKHFKIALKYAKEVNDTILISMNYTTAAYSFVNLNMIDSAYIYCTEALWLAKKIDNKFALKDALSILSTIYYKKKDIENYRKTIIELNEVKKYFSGLQVKTEIAKTEYKNKILLLEKENELNKSKNKIQFFIFIAISVILLLLLFVIIKRYKYRRVINEQRIKILQEEEKNTKIQNEKLQDDIKIRAKELISKTMLVASYNELQKNIIKQLGNINIEEKTEQEKIRQIINEIKLNSNDFWDDFFMFFNDIHKDFLTMLDSKYSNLTPTEKKIITLIKLNLSTKDISRITYCSQRTVEKHRQNIRKKLSIDNSIKLREYIVKMKTD